MRKLLTHVLVLVVLAPISCVAQGEPGQALPKLVRSNEMFGRRLLAIVQSDMPGKNVVLSPLSLTMLFADLRSSSEYGPVRSEIGKTFGWGEYPELSIPSRMLLAAFERPEQPSRPGENPRRHLPILRWKAEGTWISNSLFYQGKGTLSPEFVELSEKYFGLKFMSTASKRPVTNDLKSAGHREELIPTLSGRDDVLIDSGTHLQTAWYGNTFSMSTAYKSAFQTASGDLNQVEMLDTELEYYFHAKTESFEAVSLPCNGAYMLAILPGPGESIHDLERLLSESPDAIDSALKKELGIVSLPMFRFKFEANLRPQLEQMGIREAFQNIGKIIQIPGSYLAHVSQRIDIQVDKQGIQANAETVAGAVYGGIMSGSSPFQMKLDRPFLFLIRDRTTNALLFLGVVEDPSQH